MKTSASKNKIFGLRKFSKPHIGPPGPAGSGSPPALGRAAAGEAGTHAQQISVLLADLSRCIIASTARMIARDGALESRDPWLSNVVLETFIRPLQP